jgi:hypothetical protein
MGWIMTYPSVEPAFSIPGSIATKPRMGMTGHTMRAQLAVQANWNITRALLLDVLAIGPRRWRLVRSAMSRTNQHQWISRPKIERGILSASQKVDRDYPDQGTLIGQTLHRKDGCDTHK